MKVVSPKGYWQKENIMNVHVDGGDPFWLNFEKNIVEWNNIPDYEKEKLRSANRNFNL